MLLEDGYKRIYENVLREVLPGILRPIVREEVQAVLSDATHAADRYMTAAQAADFAQVAVDTIRLWIRQQRLKGFRAGREWRVHMSDLRAFMESGASAANDDDLNELADRAIG